MNEQPVKACYPLRSQMTAAAVEMARFGWTYVRCRMACERIEGKNPRRNAILVLNGNIVEAQLMRCKECSIRKEAADA